MGDLQVFKNKDFGEMRIKEINNTPYICLSDVCKILELEQVSRVKSRLNQDGVITSKVIDNLGREQQATFISESNLYKVIFQSRKKEAEKFTEWVTSEVLPSIRKNGGYILGQETLNDEELIQKALLVATNKLKQREAELEAQKPKVLFADSVTSSHTSILVGELAKIIKQALGIELGQNRFFKWLRENGYLIIRKGTDYNMPTQKSMELGLFEIKESTVTHPDGHVSITKTPKVTGKGQVYFINKFYNKMEENI